MSRRRTRNKSHERITITITGEAKRKLDEISEDEKLSLSAVASAMLEERVEMEETMERGGTVTIQERDGRGKQLQSFRRVRRLPPS